MKRLLALLLCAASAIAADIPIKQANGTLQTKSVSGDITISVAGVTVIGNNRVTGAMLAFGSDAQGDIAYYNGTDWVRLPAGTNGQLLQTQGVGANPQWASISGSVATDAIWNAAGDLVVGTGADAASRMALGTARQLLQVNAGATTVEWTNAISLTSADVATVNVTTVLQPGTNDGAALGGASNQWSDIFLATGAVRNYGNGNVVETHSSGILTLGTGEYRITTPGTNSASVVTVGGTQALTNKTLTLPIINNATITTSTLTYSTTPAVDFTGDGNKIITLTGDATFSGSNYGAGRSVTVIIVGDSSGRTIGFDADWVFVGAAAPTTIAANKKAILTLTDTTGNAGGTGVVAAYSVQP